MSSLPASSRSTRAAPRPPGRSPARSRTVRRLPAPTRAESANAPCPPPMTHPRDESVVDGIPRLEGGPDVEEHVVDSLRRGDVVRRDAIGRLRTQGNDEAVDFPLEFATARAEVEHPPQVPAQRL